jgi:hypothetical protein
MHGEFIFPEQSKTKVKDFVTGVANEKRHLRSSRRLPWTPNNPKLHLRFGPTKSSDASRDQKELATEVEGQTECQSA